MAEVKLSSKNQIVIPREAREKLGLKPGDKLLIGVAGKHLTVIKKPKNFVKALEELNIGPYGDDYISKERASWDR
jgi:AbrB family looped-hinge helix DNA binding protein